MAIRLLLLFIILAGLALALGFIARGRYLSRRAAERDRRRQLEDETHLTEEQIRTAEAWEELNLTRERLAEKERAIARRHHE